MPRLILSEAPDADFDHIQTVTINNFVKYEESRCVAFHKVGTGKTRLAYGWLLLLRQLGRANRCLVVLRPKALYDWRSEADHIAFDRAGINFISFANLRSLNLKNHWDTIIIDELFLFANPQSFRAKRLAYLSQRATNVLGLSGTILSKTDNTAIWGYCVVLGISSLIAKGITHFRSLYQTSFKARWDKQLTLFQPKAGWEKELWPKLGSRVSFYFPKDYVRTIDRTLELDLTSEQRRLINKLVKLYVLDTEDGEVFLKRATDVYHKLRGILNGWIQLASGRLQIVDCEKRAALLHKVDELHESGERCVVWCAYRNDVTIIRSALQVPSLPLVGGCEFDLPRWNRGDARIVVATMGSGQSINFLNSVKWGLFYSLSTKRLDWQQARGRMGRRGVDATSPNQFIRYSVRATLDGKIYQRIQETEDAEDSIIAEFQREYNIQLPR